MTADTSFSILVVALFVLMLSLARRASEPVQPPQIVYVQAEAPQSSGAAWLLLILVVFLLLKTLGLM